MDCNPMYKDDAKKIINVERLYMLAEVLCKTGSLHPEYHFNYPFERDVNITSYILEVRLGYSSPPLHHHLTPT